VRKAALGCFLDGGVILEQGPPEQIFSEPQDLGRSSSSSEIVEAGRL
jgi:polar amino acid transport system ATP-binding protein